MRLRAARDSPELPAFLAALDPVNALAEQSPGFVWRLKSGDGNSTSIRIFDDATLLVNMSTAPARARTDAVRVRRADTVPAPDASTLVAG